MDVELYINPGETAANQLAAIRKQMMTAFGAHGPALTVIWQGSNVGYHNRYADDPHGK